MEFNFGNVDIEKQPDGWHWRYNRPMQQFSDPWWSDDKAYPTASAAMAAAKAYIEEE